jgi:hypothetical protein
MPSHAGHAAAAAWRVFRAGMAIASGAGAFNAREVAMTMVVGTFKSLLGAQRAVTDLVTSGYGRATISILVRQARQGDSPFEGAPAAGGLAASGSSWRVLAGGPLATSLRDTHADAAEASVARALITAGLGQAAARFFAEAIAHGAVVVAVHCEDARVRDARDILDVHAEPAIESSSEFPRNGEDVFPQRPFASWQSPGG